ncbi:MAG: hypothetical protein IJT02_08105 [Synergistaceae bacterium]|nr:hypothetical protein [Synergistaceae bacterium]
MTELEERLRATEEYFREMNDEAFRTCREYDRLRAKVNEVRAEYRGICEVLRAPHSGKPYAYLTGLVMLKQRMHDEYRDVRLASLRTLKLCCALLAETNRAYRDYMSLKKRLRKIKEEKTCAGV